MKNLNGLEVIARGGDAIYIRVPSELQLPCNGCDCDYCKAHPELEPKWDTVAVPVFPSKLDVTWTVHMPDAKAFMKAIKS